MKRYKSAEFCQFVFCSEQSSTCRCT